MRPEYQVTRTQPTVYLDEGGKPVRGFLVTVRFTEFKEIHEIHVDSLNPSTVKAAIETLLAERQALADLGA